MKKIKFWRFFLFTLIFSPLLSFASQPAPADFEVNSKGEIFGKLEDGTDFSQVNVYKEPKIQKFSWEEGSWYVTDKGIIKADSNLQALSIYLNS
jgi:hypothetical protein